MKSIALLLVAVCVVAAVAETRQAPNRSKLSLFPAAGFEPSAYDELSNAIQTSVATSNASICVAHSTEGAARLAEDAVSSQCTHAVFLGSAPSPELLAALQLPSLVLHGLLDGVVRFSRFAVHRHRVQQQQGLPTVVFGALRGASHHSFASGKASKLVQELDLQPVVTHTEVVGNVSAAVRDFVGLGSGVDLAAAEVAAEDLSGPLIKALELEGSTALGHPACNSDFPTNPTCSYPMYPNHALGPRAAAPNPPLPADCICGSRWVAEEAAYRIAGFDSSTQPGFKVTAKDAFHDVSDVHPFHLPHIFNSCQTGAESCTLNATTLTMPVNQSSPLFPNNPVSIFEFRAKIKSRQASWESAGLGSQSGDLDKKNMTMCRQVNQAAYDWALANAEASVKAKFDASGEPFVMVDDKAAAIGMHGPEWIKDSLVYTRTTGTGLHRTSTGQGGKGTQIEIQSWQFSVGNTNEGHLPWFVPVGMHYCKLLSPARAMEWIYTDGLRAAAGASQN